MGLFLLPVFLLMAFMVVIAVVGSIVIIRFVVKLIKKILNNEQIDRFDNWKN